MNKGMNILEILLICIGFVLMQRGYVKNDEISQKIFGIVSKLRIDFIDIKFISFLVANIFILFWCASLFLYYRRVKQ